MSRVGKSRFLVKPGQQSGKNNIGVRQEAEEPLYNKIRPNTGLEIAG